MKKHERIFQSYRRNHAGEHFEDAEKSKIARDKQQGKKLKREAENLLLRAVANTDDHITDEVDAILHESKKTAGNVTAHKSRLVELQKNDDFI